MDDSGQSTLPLRVDSVAAEAGEFTQTLYCTDCEGTELRVGVRGTGPAAIQPDTGHLFHFDDVVRSTVPGAELLLRSGVADAERVGPPERRSQPPLSDLDEPWLTQLHASERLVVVTVQPRPMSDTTPPRAVEPETFEIGSVCLGYASRSDKMDVYHREESEPKDEQLLLEHVVEDLSEVAGATLVTGGLDRNPLGLLRTRLNAGAGGEIIDSDAAQVLDDCFHADMSSLPARAGEAELGATAQRLGIEHDVVSLEDYDIGVKPSDWREGWDIDASSLSSASDPQMTDRDYATLIERYLDADESAPTTELGRCLKAYASVDVPLLSAFATDDALGGLACSRPAGRLPTSV